MSAKCQKRTFRIRFTLAMPGSVPGPQSLPIIPATKKGVGRRPYMKTSGCMVSSALTLALMTSASFAQDVTGIPGSPSATTTIDGRQIPPPPGNFGGTINLDALNSTPYWQPTVVPPKGAPNILLIITDDVGFAAPSTFGGVIPTPTLDRI